MYLENNEENYKIDTSKDNEKFILSSIFFKKYKPIKKLDKGSFSVIYEGKNIETDEKIALKIEPKNKFNFLKSEASYLYILRKGPGIPKIISFGITKNYNILIEPLLGKNLYSLFIENNKQFTIKDICLISLQCITQFEFIHSKGVIHCDIKPENYAIGEKDKRIIYLFDFGLSKKYRSDRTKNHIQFKLTKTMTGTARYASRNCLSGEELSRRDDLESFCYTILYFMTKKLPWQGIKAKTMTERYRKIYIEKMNLEKWEKFEDIPLQIQNFIIYCRNLKFTQDPNYKLMKLFFKNLMREEYLDNDKNFSWIKDKSILSNKLEEEYISKKYYSINELFNKLKKSSTNFNSINIINNYENKKIKKIKKHKFKSIYQKQDIKDNYGKDDNNNDTHSVSSIYNNKIDEIDDKLVENEEDEK